MLNSLLLNKIHIEKVLSICNKGYENRKYVKIYVEIQGFVKTVVSQTPAATQKE